MDSNCATWSVRGHDEKRQTERRRSVSPDIYWVFQEMFISPINESFGSCASLLLVASGLVDFAFQLSRDPPDSRRRHSQYLAVCFPPAAPSFLQMNCHIPSAEHQSTLCNPGRGVGPCRPRGSIAQSTFSSRWNLRTHKRKPCLDMHIPARTHQSGLVGAAALQIAFSFPAELIEKQKVKVMCLPISSPPRLDVKRH